MRQVNMHEAKTHLSRLVEEVAGGEEVVIAKAGKPIAKLVPILREPATRVLGTMRGQIWMADDFDAPLPLEILAGFNGEASVTADAQFDPYSVPPVHC